MASYISSLLGLILEMMGTYGQALIFRKMSLAIREELQDKVGMAEEYSNIGNVLSYQHNFEEALEHHNKALEIHQKLQDIVGMAEDYTNIGSRCCFIFIHKPNPKLQKHQKY